MNYKVEAVEWEYGLAKRKDGEAMKEMTDMNTSERKSAWKGAVMRRLRKDFVDAEWEHYKKNLFKVTVQGLTKYFTLEPRKKFTDADLENVRDMVLVIMYSNVVKNNKAKPIFIDKEG